MLTRRFHKEVFRQPTMQALVLLGAVVLVGGVFIVAHVLRMPDFGFALSSDSNIKGITLGSSAESAGLQVGDKVISIDGVPFHREHLHWQPGQQVTHLLVSREGQTISLEIQATPPHIPWHLIVFYVIAFAYWAIATLALFFRPGEPTAPTFVLVLLLGAASIFVWSAASDGVLWASLLMGVLALCTGPTFVYYHTIFPDRIDFRGRTALLVGLAVISIALLPFYALTCLGIETPITSAHIMLFFSLCLAIGVALLVRILLTATNKTSRRQAALILSGTISAFLPLVLLVLIPHIFSMASAVNPWLPLMTLILMPASYFYAMYRHNLMALDKAANRSAVLFLISLIFATLYLGLRAVLPDGFSGPVTIADIVLVVLMVSLYGVIKTRVQRVVDSVFYGGWYQHDRLVHRMSGALGDALENQAIADLLVNDLAITMRFKKAALLLRDNDGEMLVQENREFQGVSPSGKDGALARLLLRVGEPIQHGVLRDRLRSEPEAQEELATWSTYEAQTWVPLVHQGKLIGVLLLGNRVGDEFLTKEDHHTLGTLAHHAAVALANAQVVAQLRGKIHETQALAKQVLALQEKNQTRLAQELHDDTAHALSFAIQFLESPLESYSPRKVNGVRDVLEVAYTNLYNIMIELRPPNLGDDLEKALKQYVAGLWRRRRLSVALHTNGNGTPVPREIRIAVFRICQESLHNAWKHAQAEQIEVKLDLREDSVRLVVVDDGVGFEVPDHLGFLIEQQHLGLVGMRERAESIGGTCEVKSEIGRGTQILVDIPVSVA